MNNLFLQLDEFIQHAYTEMVIIKGYEAYNATLFVDPQTCKACFQVLFDDDYNTIEFNSEPEPGKYYLLENVCKGIKHDFSFFDNRSIVADVFYDITKQIRKHIFNYGYRKEMDFAICFVILD